MVRKYILTDREKEIITFYLETGRMLDGYRELKHILQNMDIAVIDEDRILIRNFLDRSS
jgi:hypothetical protein